MAHDHTSEEHNHTYDKDGNQTCCSLEEKVNARADGKLKPEDKSGHPAFESLKVYAPSVISFILLITGIILDSFFPLSFFKGYVRLAWYALAYLPVGIPVLIDAVKAMLKKDIFSEFLLMGIATIGAFAIGEYPEGVAVMLFYAVGELFQSAAVKRAKGNIKALLDVMPDTATLIRGNDFVTVHPEEVKVGELIQVKVGEKVPLDGSLVSDKSSFNTAALTGESTPSTITKGEQVLAGMINIENVIEVKVTRKYAESSISRILDMVQNAAARKAPTELFIRKFARIYTPIVVLLAVLLTAAPALFVKDYVFSDWLYRALVFLVISCPCALVISIPLGYFGGIGAASRNGILFKGSNYLDLLTKVKAVIADKTGTLTKGIFKVQQVKSVLMPEDAFLALTASLESQSTHPVAKAVLQYAGDSAKISKALEVEEISGHGLKGKVDGKAVLAGNAKLLRKFNISFPEEINTITDTIVVVAVDNVYGGYITISDELKEDASETVADLKQMGIEIVMLSGDKQSVVNKVADKLGIKKAFGDLLPEGKVERVEAHKVSNPGAIAFAGDGVNDAPVLAVSDVGFAMGAMGSDAAIETADVVIQTDHPSKIVTAIRISKATKKIVWQNIILAFAVKGIVLALGAGGLATMWEAVFADVGVALLAILNAVRIQRMKFR